MQGTEPAFRKSCGLNETSERRSASGSQRCGQAPRWPLPLPHLILQAVLGSRGHCSQRPEMETEAQRASANFGGVTANDSAWIQVDRDSKVGFGARPSGRPRGHRPLGAGLAGAPQLRAGPPVPASPSPAPPAPRAPRHSPSPVSRGARAPSRQCALLLVSRQPRLGAAAALPPPGAGPGWAPAPPLRLFPPCLPAPYQDRPRSLRQGPAGSHRGETEAARWGETGRAAGGRWGGRTCPAAPSS